MRLYEIPCYMNRRAKCASPIGQLLPKNQSRKNSLHKHILLSSDGDKKLENSLWLLLCSLLHFCTDHPFQWRTFLRSHDEIVVIAKRFIWGRFTFKRNIRTCSREYVGAFPEAVKQLQRRSLKPCICMAATSRFSWRLRRFSGPDLKVGLR